MERELVTRERVPFVSIEAGAMHGVGPARALRGALRTVRGVRSAVRAIDQFRPDVVLLTGGFVGVPVSVAAWLRGVPSVVYLPDIEPGRALKVMARFATKVATTTESSSGYIDATKMVVTGYPVRDVFAAVTRDDARSHFGLPRDARVVLVYGGSKGARSINRAVIAGLSPLLDRAWVLHVSGANDWDEVCVARDGLSPERRTRYLVFKYLHEEMATAMAAADLAVCRSGASTLGELPYLGLPAILVPYPFAWRYQKVNAHYLADKGAAIVLDDERLTDAGDGLVRRVAAVLDDEAALAAMRAAALRCGRRDGAARIATLLADVAARNRAAKASG